MTELVTTGFNYPTSPFEEEIAIPNVATPTRESLRVAWAREMTSTLGEAKAAPKGHEEWSASSFPKAFTIPYAEISANAFKSWWSPHHFHRQMHLYDFDVGFGSSIAPLSHHFLFVALPDAGITEAATRRIEELKAGLEEGERFNDASSNELLDFVSRYGLKEPSIFLLDSGDLRASWRDGPDRYFGLQFLGGGDAQFTIVAGKTETGRVPRAAGIVSLAGLSALAASFGMTGLVFR